MERATLHISRAAIPLMLVCLLFFPAGCSRTALRSTRLTDSDLDEVVQRMRASLAASDFFAKRSSKSEPAVIVINRVENLTSDVLSEAEQWMLVARLRGALPIQTMAWHKNIQFQIPPEKYAILIREGFDGELGPAESATHVMWATFRSARRAGRRDGHGPTDIRSDYYYLEYRITDLRTRKVMWTDSFQIKREAVGLAID